MPNQAGGGGGAATGASTPILDAIMYGVSLVDHVVQQARVYQVIQKGLAIPPNPMAGQEDLLNLFHNTAEWISAGNCTLTVLTKAQSGYAAQIGAGEGEEAFFDTRVQYPAYGGSYDSEATGLSAGVEIEDNDTLGGMGPDGNMALYEPKSMGTTELVGTLVHEIQHQADRSWAGMIWAHPSGSTYSDYQSEFRAYWIESEETDSDGHGSSTDPAENTKMVDFTDPVSNEMFFEVTEFDNKRQENIFWYLIENGYDYVPEAYTQDAAFKQMADEFTGPVGGNLVNSVRIQELTDAIVACNPGMAEDDPAIRNVFTKARALDEIDEQFLSDRARSASFWDTATGNLGDELGRQLRNVVLYGGRWVGDFPTDVTPAGPGNAFA
ncbi:MAG: hypothetical protein JRI25_07680 [Deltaproteobacteria bacterium]|nr:hypothetical protein [Deltaproteobacteria bacterium]